MQQLTQYHYATGTATSSKATYETAAQGTGTVDRVKAIVIPLNAVDVYPDLPIVEQDRYLPSTSLRASVMCNILVW